MAVIARCSADYSKLWYETHLDVLVRGNGDSWLSVCVWLHVPAEVESRYIGWLTYIAQLGYNEVTSHPASEPGLILLCILKAFRTIAAAKWLAVLHISLLDERTLNIDEASL